MEILCSLRLVLEGKTGKEILESSRLELENVLANNFALSDVEGNTFVENTSSYSPEVLRAKFLGNDGLLF